MAALCSISIFSWLPSYVSMTWICRNVHSYSSNHWCILTWNVWNMYPLKWQPKLIAVSETVTFANPKAPVYPRLAQGKSWNEVSILHPFLCDLNVLIAKTESTEAISFIACSFSLHGPCPGVLNQYKQFCLIM